MEKENPSYYTVIPADVRYDKNLSLLEKLLYAEIIALTNKEGYCWASNQYFARLFDKNDKYISSKINHLAKLGYLKINVDRAGGNSRKIWIPIQKNLNTYSEKAEHPYSEKAEHNNTSINNTNNITTKNTIASDEASIIAQYFNKVFSKQYRLTPDRTKRIKLRLKSYTVDEIKKAIDNLKQSKFHNGENDRCWKATIDFIIRNDEKIDEFLNSAPVKDEDIIITKKPYFMGKPMTKDLKLVIFGQNDLRTFAGNKKDIEWK